MLAVEHIQAKSIHPALIGSWRNFVLGCSNCNSSKLAKNPALSEVFIPDRDNTAVLFDYRQDGRLEIRQGLAASVRAVATQTLTLTGLDKVPAMTLDANERQVALDRVAQRMECWLYAEDARVEIEAQPGNEGLRQTVVKLALSSGFFSVWMRAFEHDLDMRLRFIHAFPGTAASGCFDLQTAEPVSPAPNPDHLPYGGKI